MGAHANSELLAHHSYHLHTLENGAIAGHAWTNDNLDRGYPNEQADWAVHYRNREEMKRLTGLSHIGINGCVVAVYLDGKKI